MAYLEQMKKIVSIELDKIKIFNNYSFSEKDGVFLVDVPLTLAGFSFMVVIVLRERMEVKVSGWITDELPIELTSEIEILVELFNRRFCEDNVKFVTEGTSPYYYENWESSIYTVDEEDYNAKEDLENLRNTITLSPVARLAPFCLALRKIIDEDLSAEEAFINAVTEDD